MDKIFQHQNSYVVTVWQSASECIENHSTLSAQKHKYNPPVYEIKRSVEQESSASGACETRGDELTSICEWCEALTAWEHLWAARVLNIHTPHWALANMNYLTFSTLYSHSSKYRKNRLQNCLETAETNSKMFFKIIFKQNDKPTFQEKITR